MKLPVPLSFDWDQGNKEKNWVKHQVYFREAEEIFQDESIVILKDPKHSRTEKRYVSYGVSKKRRKLTVIFTLRTGLIIIISARNQNKKERNVYVKNKTK